MGRPRLVMGRKWLGLLVVAAVVCAVVVAVGFRLLQPALGSSPIDVHLGDIASLQLQPVPEGPTLVLKPANQEWSLIEGAIPIPLPAPVDQPLGCDSGGDLIVGLKDGRTITYGPCRHPKTIRALWARIEVVDSKGRCTNGCAPTE
jgi:hypothetical protein